MLKSLKITLEKETDNGPVRREAYFNCSNKTILHPNQVADSLPISREEILAKISQRMLEGSGWIVISVDAQYLNIARYQPLAASSYIKLPEELRNSAKGLINLKNEELPLVSYQTLKP